MSSLEEIPFLDLITPHLEMEEELTAVFRRALHTAAFIGGQVVEEFETEFADFCGATYAVAVGSGTDALRFAIMAAGVQPGDVVITVPHTFIATTEAISQAGAIPEFVDIDEITYNMSSRSLEHFVDEKCTRNAAGRLISRRHGKPVTAIIPVHLYGQMVDMDPIMRIAETHQLMVLEDACQAHGAEYFSLRAQRWIRAGSVGVAAAFSFYPGKNLGACGEAGAVTTNDPELASKVKVLRDHGQARKYFHNLEGYNGRLDAIQAGLLRIKLQRLPEWNARRRERAEEYNRLLAGVPGVICPLEPSWSRAVY
ncbi:MAG TPA: DegT/DnrJ/EryC1/StrS family aminotransferase, partial [Acidobacteriaceae bacterium]|nr:DegT/DnrJ/EryC1/StrS family aminotransferase [Acidobacteriaceae bacterium]